jgi:glutamine amidotransferase
MLKKIGVKAKFTNDIDEISSAEKIILPGVGAYDHCAKALDSSGLIPVLENLVTVEKRPILGICVGMQLLLNSSEEGSLAGLGWIDGRCVKFDSSSGLKVPHMGWNTVTPRGLGSILTGSGNAECRYYFVHSYYAKTAEENVLATCHYGSEFACAIRKENIYGVQFHPEKSHKYGMNLLKKFMEL